MRRNCVLAGLDFSADYRNQDPDKLSNVFKLVSVATIP